jgi:hypothetical protein
MLPNTAGCATAEEAVRVARLGRELARLAGQDDNTFVKLEVIPDSRHLLPDPIGTLEAAEILVKEGFTVLPYINADPLLARRLDARLAGLARKLDFTYTRYADDLTFSGDAAAAAKTGYLLTRIRHLIADERLTVNEQKTRVQRPGAQQTVTGIVVNQRPNVPRTTVRRLRAILHDARHHGLDAANREGRENFADWLGGMIAYVSMVNPGRGRELREEFDRVTG